MKNLDIEQYRSYSPKDDLMQNNVILVTGAGDGIGRVACLNYAKCGATLILAGRTVAKLEAVYDEIIEAGCPQPTIYPIDLSGATEDDYGQLSELIQAQFGKLDGLLHNAGVLGSRRPIGNYKLSDWDQCMNVNVRSQFLLTRALLPLLELSDQGRIIFTSSGVGRTGRAHWGAYAVSKFATEGLMEVLADELEGVSQTTVNAINPGPTRTRMRANAYPAENPAELPTPEDLMWLYLYLMGPDSQAISGQSIDAGPR